MSVALLDAGARPGGQFWRHAEGKPPVRFELSGVDYLPGSRIWFLEPGFRVHTETAVIQGERLIVATGAYDRSVPFPGWQLPGVVTAGAAQALLKEHGVAIGSRVVVAGSGPFLLPVAAGLATAGVKVQAVLESSKLRGYLTAVPPLSKTLQASGYAITLAKHRIPYKRGRTIVAAHGTDHVTAVQTRHETIECDALAVSYGFTPQIELPLAIGCAVHTVDGSLVVSVNDRQETSVGNVFAAGEVTGIGGSDLAWVEGQIAGLACAGQDIPKALRRRRHRLQRFAGVLERVHPAPPVDCPEETVLCRCEGVTVGEVKAAPAIDGRGVKLMTRAGMGWCQGRTCGYAVACVLSQRHQRRVSVPDLLAFGTRPIAQPITLGELIGDESR